MKTTTAALPVMILFASPAFAQKTYTPATGTAERNAILNVMREDFYRSPAAAARNAESILLVVHHLRIKGRWILVHATPTISGKPVAEPRWALIQKSGNQFHNRHFRRAISAYLTRDNEHLAYEMNPLTMRLIHRAFPTCPPDIFPS